MKKYLLILAIVSIATHFAYFGYPAETVFDEVHFGKFISGYFTHEYFFDIHPPLGKLMISGMGYLAGFKPGFSFETIGQGFSDNTYLWLRLLPVLAGALLPIVIFFLIRHLKVSNIAAFAGAMLIVFENALLVQSRFILLDSFLLLFGFSSLLFYLKYKNSSSTTNYKLQTTNLFLAGLFASLAVSVKWTGATFLALILILELTRIINLRTSQVLKGLAMSKYLSSATLALIIAPAVVYFSIFAIHFSLLNKSGPGDAFMTPEFRKTLVGSSDYANSDIQPLNILEKFKELNIQMYKSNATLTATHPYSSQWYTWPFMERPIYYWNQASDKGQETSDQVQSRIYLLGNPAVWWAATLAMIYVVVQVGAALIKKLTSRLAMSKILKKSADIASQYNAGQCGWDQNYGHFVFVYILNLLPFIGIKRAMFLYHYFPALIFSIIALVYVLDAWGKKNPALEEGRDYVQKEKSPLQGRGKTAFAVLIAASVAAFIFFAPLTYGLPLTEKAYHWRTWLGSWI